MGIKKSEARVLLCIEFLSKEKARQVNISEISKNLSITAPSTTEFVKNLINKCYIERHVNENDKRVIEITLTDEGEKIVRDLKKYFNSLFSGIIERLGKEQSELLIELLDKVNIYFNEWYTNPK
jgi:DNA-binding MarR family transcriptional regulator